MASNPDSTLVVPKGGTKVIDVVTRGIRIARITVNPEGYRGGDPMIGIACKSKYFGTHFHWPDEGSDTPVDNIQPNPVAQKLLEHFGHDIEIVTYGKEPKLEDYALGAKNSDPWNVAVECRTCNEVLIDFDMPAHYES